jgi:hypothetical protein
VNGPTHRAVVRSVTHRAHKRRRRHPARSANASLRVGCRDRRKQILAAAYAAVFPCRRNFTPASRANRRFRNFRDEGATKGAGRREQRATQCVTQAVQDLSGRRCRRAPEEASRSGDTSRNTGNR